MFAHTREVTATRQGCETEMRWKRSRLTQSVWRILSRRNPMEQLKQTARCPRQFLTPPFFARRPACCVHRSPSLGLSSIPPRKQGTIAHATILPGSTPQTQRIVAGSKLDVEVPVAAVQKLPVPAQSAVFLGICAVLGLSTYLLCTCVGLGWTQNLAWLCTVCSVFIYTGVTHFTIHDNFCSIMPHKGAWGLWYLPGSDSFHVNWTGVAEVLGGVGLLASTLPVVREAMPWLRTTTAICLFYLTIAITPANIYMFSHNSPGPLPKGVFLPPIGHFIRGVIQVVMLATLWGLAQTTLA